MVWVVLPRCLLAERLHVGLQDCREGWEIVRGLGGGCSGAWSQIEAATRHQGAVQAATDFNAWISIISGRFRLPLHLEQRKRIFVG